MSNFNYKKEDFLVCLKRDIDIYLEEKGYKCYKTQEVILRAFSEWYTALDDISKGGKWGRIYGLVTQLYLWRGAGHTTLWLILQKVLSDVIVVSETKNLSIHTGTEKSFSVNSQLTTYKDKVMDKVIIIDSGGFNAFRYESFIDNVIKSGAKGVLIS